MAALPAIPSISDIKEQILADYESELAQDAPALPKAFIVILATAVAGAIWLVYRFGLWVYNQISSTKADIDSLRRIGDQYGIYETGAVAAVMEVSGSGTDGATIPAGTNGQSGGFVYTTTADATVASGVYTVNVRCLDVDAGAAGTRDIGEVFEWITPIAGIQREAVIADLVTAGVDAESVEDYRRRILTRQRTPPQGGATPDWVQWALEVPGVTKALAWRIAPGEIGVYILVGDTFETRLPTPSQLEAVTDYISDPIRRPLNCETAEAMLFSEVVFDIELSGLVPNEAAIREAIVADIKAFLLDRFPRQYVYDPNAKDVISITELQAIAKAAGAQSVHIDVTMPYNGAFTDAYQLLEDELAAPGKIAFV